MKATGITDKTEAKEKNLGSHTGEETAAIAMALHEYLNDAHDVEDMILTINKVKRTYSPMEFEDLCTASDSVKKIITNPNKMKQ